jgi:YhgE/Pip-like protein
MSKIGLALKAFFKQKSTLIGIVTALMFQLVFSLVWMTGYNGVSSKIGKIELAAVIEDEAASNLFKSFVSQMPFSVSVIESLSEAEAQLTNRDVHLVMRIPQGFLQAVQERGIAEIEFLINESNPVMLKGTTEAIAVQLTNQLNQLLADSDSKPITANVQSLNPVGNFADQMAPLMIVIASYVGATVMGMNMHQSASTVLGHVGRWPLYMAWALINIGSALFIALTGTVLIHWLGSGIEQGFLVMWAFQSLFLVAFMFVSHLFVIVFGLPGMLFNIAMLSVQLVASGAMVPRELLPDSFRTISEFLPATHAVEGSMNILFGGPSPGQASLSLALFIAVAVVIAGCVVAWRREKNPSLAVDAIR